MHHYLIEENRSAEVWNCLGALLLEALRFRRCEALTKPDPE
jgi:hypothetical protein